LKRLSKTEKTKVKVDSGSIIYADRNAYTVNSRLQRPRSPRSTSAATVSSAVPSQRQARPTKRRILLKFYVEWAPAPTARSVRGSSRPIMSMRFRPANIRVINRRASSSAVIGSALPTRVLKTHQRERVPAPPPVEDIPMPERCLQQPFRNHGQEAFREGTGWRVLDRVG